MTKGKYIRTEEHKKNISLAKKGKPSGQKGIHKPSPMEGKKHSEESKIKMRQSAKGRIFTEEYKLHLKIAQKKVRANLPYINCEECNKKVKMKSWTQRFCYECGKDREIQSKWNKLKINHPDRYKARFLARGHIELKESCEICGSTNHLHRHHWRYDKPLLVNTLCVDCHQIQHVNNFAQSKFGGITI